jgi:hypothetical protein
LAAADWTPDDSVADTEGYVRPEIVWAALDCPTYFTYPPTGELQANAVLASMAIHLVAQVSVNKPHVIMAWPISEDGRKRHAGMALYTEDSELCAIGRALWIRMRGA